MTVITGRTNVGFIDFRGLRLATGGGAKNASKAVFRFLLKDLRVAGF